MRLAAIFTVAVWASIACGSTTTVDPVSAPQQPQCRGATGATGPGSVACNACLENKCGSDIAPASSACGSYFKCYASCRCLDSACIDGCASKIDTPCTLGGAALLTCEMNSCTSQCAAAHTPADSGPTDGASG
jgi:hypothetical protein